MYVRSAKNSPEDELAMRPICTRHTRKGRSATYRLAYHRKACFDEIVEEEKKAEVQRHMQRMHRSKVLSFGRGIVGAAVLLSTPFAFSSSTKHARLRFILALPFSILS